MIVIDTSAIIAILLDEPDRRVCQIAPVGDDERYISAGTVTELMIVAQGREVFAELLQLLKWIQPVVDPVDEVVAQRIGEMYVRFGKGRHPAALNYGDCVAYELAQRKGCPLLFIGDDFSQTDVESVL